MILESVKAGARFGDLHIDQRERKFRSPKQLAMFTGELVS